VLITVLHFVNNAIHVGFMTGDSSHLTVPRVFRRTNATTGS
jgi:hypothetical protein